MPTYRCVYLADIGDTIDGEYPDDATAIAAARTWATEWVDDTVRREAAETGYPIVCKAEVYRDPRDEDDHGELIETVVETFSPLYPTCIDGGEHEWDEPDAVLHGGGYISTQDCFRCDVRRTVDTWAPDGSGGHCRIERMTRRPPEEETCR